jgi:PAS domain S-box-containing protein
MNDLASALGMPAMWSGREAHEIVDSLLESLLRMLDLDFVYAQLNASDNGSSIAALKVAQSIEVDVASEIGESLRSNLSADSTKWPSLVRTRLRGNETSIFPARLGMRGDIGAIATGSKRQDFPQDTERLVISVAANQAAVGLQQAWLLKKQKQIAQELDRRVGQRTSELALINEELRKEIVERKLTEERLLLNESALREAHAKGERSEERWRSVFENSAIGVALTDLDGCFIATNPVYQKMLGYTAEELEELTFLDVTHEEDLNSNRELIAELIEEKRGQFQIEKQYRRKDGSLMWVRNNVSLVPGTERAPKFLMALSEDITERRLAEEALVVARSELANVARLKSLSVLTASIAHEVNQPLSGIVTNASTCLRMLDGDPPNIEGARETARRTIRDGNRASDVVARLRAVFSKKEIAAESVDLNEAAREVIALSQGELQRTRVVLRQELADELPLVKGDRVQLQQVIQNLLRNACDAMGTVDDRPRQLVIRTEPEDENRVRVSVQDAGIGFDPQFVHRLFEAFYTTKNDGMGIGLSVSRSIIEAHHGRLWASQNDGPGATFAFSLPLDPEHAAAGNALQPPSNAELKPGRREN